MSYYFQNANNNFSGLSTVYNVYDDENFPITSIVVGYCSYNSIFFFTEYRGAGSSSNVGITEQKEFNNILYDFSQIFEYMDYSDIFSKEDKYNDYKSEVPPITKDNLHIYDSYGEIAYVRGEYVIVPDDKYVEHLVDKEILEGTRILLEDYDDDGNLYVNLNEYDISDDIPGFFLRVKDWEALKIS